MSNGIAVKQVISATKKTNAAEKSPGHRASAMGAKLLNDDLRASADISVTGFYQKQGCNVAATIDCEPPGLARYYMMKKL